MTILTMPLTPAPQTHKFGLDSNTAGFPSIFTKSVQTSEWPGARWRMSLVFPAMTYEQAAAFKVFLVKLRGQAGRFYGYDPDYAIRGPQGTALGAGKVNGAGQTGTGLITDGWTAGQAKLFALGDMIAYDTSDGRQLHMITEDIAADGAGEATLPIEAPIRTSPADNADIIIVKPSCIMMLDDPRVEWDSDRLMMHGITINATEAFR